MVIVLKRPHDYCFVTSYYTVAKEKRIYNLSQWDDSVDCSEGWNLEKRSNQHRINKNPLAQSHSSTLLSYFSICQLYNLHSKPRPVHTIVVAVIGGWRFACDFVFRVVELRGCHYVCVPYNVMQTATEKDTARAVNEIYKMLWRVGVSSEVLIPRTTPKIDRFTIWNMCVLSIDWIMSKAKNRSP